MSKTKYVEIDEIQHELHISKARASEVIRKMNNDQIRMFPHSLVLKDKVNRYWYENCILETQKQD